MLYLTLAEVLRAQARAIERTRGGHGVRSLEDVEAAVVQVQGGFGDVDFYPTLAEKAAFLGFSLIKNHPFLDGNKRVGVLAMDTFLILNGYEVVADADEHEQLIFGLASGRVSREEFFAWVAAHVVPLAP